MRVRSINREDLPQIAAITLQAFRDDELNAWLFPHKGEHPEDFRKFISIRIRSRAVGWGQHGFVVVTEESDPDWTSKPEIVGYAYLLRCGEDEGAKKWRAEPWFNKIERKLLDWEKWYDFRFIDRASDPQRIARYMSLTSWEAFPALDSRWHLSILAVPPKHQRRGIGNMLVEHGQKIAADDALPLTLESSVVGRKLYFNRGFKVVGERRIPGEYDDLMMVWESEALKGRWLDESEGNKAIVKAVVQAAS
ncbi:acyl-CoA N-acyltransferase [Byssothecium circinans]|uniref:Acyl-CoA N-acyltransferase n=1 Tax=Byssothecium circinans TaxID=147558 RepID=A0A6A5U9V2_9PLEO|nr:acyl-CoA N-acyltransferase [Byssothecium circinans]